MITANINISLTQNEQSSYSYIQRYTRDGSSRTSLGGTRGMIQGFYRTSQTVFGPKGIE